jgi:hypothetical protein
LVEILVMNGAKQNGRGTMRGIIWLIVLCGVVAGRTGVAEETTGEPDRRAVAEKYLALANDDDWLTGVWLYLSDDAMTLYTLFEKDGEHYRATNYYRRYTITWWTARVEKGQDHIRIWDYAIDHDRLVVRDDPSQIFYLQDGKLKTSVNIYYSTMRPVTDHSELTALATRPFTTGRAYLERQLETHRRLREVTDFYDVIIASPTLKQSDPVWDLDIVAQEITDDDAYLLTRISQVPPWHSGAKGAAVWDGYYWVHLHRHLDRWFITSDWLFTDSSSHGKEVVMHKSETAGYRFVRQEEFGDTPLETYIFPAPGLRHRPVKQTN